MNKGNDRKGTSIEPKIITKSRESFLRMRKIENELEQGNFDDIGYLIENGSELALEYALEWGAYYGKMDIVSRIITLGINVTCSNGAALQMACSEGHIDLLKYMMDLVPTDELSKINLLFEAINHNQLEIIRYLVKYKNGDAIKYSELDIQLNNRSVETLCTMENCEIKTLITNGD